MMLHPSEPMALGSPTSPSSPGAHAAYLPGYLLGDSTAASPSPRMWSNVGPSPSKQHLSRGGGWGASPQPSTLGNTSLIGSYGATPRSDIRTREVMTPRTKEKAGAPPVQGLMDHHSTLQVPHSMNHSRLDTSRLSVNESFAGNQSQYLTPGVHHENFASPAPSSISFHQPARTKPSPAQIDPFYTQGEAISPEEKLDDTWVTIFGFPPGTSSFILQQFSQYGNILKYVVSSEGNWIHIHYQTKIQASKALSKHGKIFGSSIMIGVTPCIDKSVMESEKEVDEISFRTDIHSTPSGKAFKGASTSISHNVTPIRPLTAAYRAASSDHEVLQKSVTPHKTSNMFSKAMEYMFGW